MAARSPGLAAWHILCTSGGVVNYFDRLGAFHTACLPRHHEGCRCNILDVGWKKMYIIGAVAQCAIACYLLFLTLYSPYLPLFPLKLTSLRTNDRPTSMPKTGTKKIKFISWRAICSVSLSRKLLLFEYWCYDKDEHSSEILSVSWVQIRCAPKVVLKSWWNECVIRSQRPKENGGRDIFWDKP